jgi:hypothetical protein
MKTDPECIFIHTFAMQRKLLCIYVHVCGVLQAPVYVHMCGTVKTDPVCIHIHTCNAAGAALVYVHMRGAMRPDPECILIHMCNAAQAAFCVCTHAWSDENRS